MLNYNVAWKLKIYEPCMPKVVSRRTGLMNSYHSNNTGFWAVVVAVLSFQYKKSSIVYHILTILCLSLSLSVDLFNLHLIFKLFSIVDLM